MTPTDTTAFHVTGQAIDLNKVNVMVKVDEVVNCTNRDDAAMTSIDKAEKKLGTLLRWAAYPSISEYVERKEKPTRNATQQMAESGVKGLFDD